MVDSLTVSPSCVQGGGLRREFAQCVGLFEGRIKQIGSSRSSGPKEYPDDGCLDDVSG